MTAIQSTSAAAHIVWVYTSDLESTLDAATWLDTTAELRRLGCRVTLISEGSPERRQIRGVDIVCIPKPNLYLVRQIVFHARFIYFFLSQSQDPDIVLFHPISAPWMLLVRLIRMVKMQSGPLLVMDTRTLHMEPRGRESRRGFARRVFNTVIERSAGIFADGQTAITFRLAQALRIPSGRLWGVWPSGVDPRKYQIAEQIRKWPEEHEPVRLIYIGSLHYERNLMPLCQAVEEANRSGMRFELLLVGKGTEADHLNSFAKSTSGSVQVLPPIPYDQVPEILAQAHVGVLPFPDQIKFQVSSPIKLFEYMAAGLPVLATRIACHTDVVNGDTYAVWAEGGDTAALLKALVSFWQIRRLLPAMGRQASSAVPAWTWQAAAEKLREALDYGLDHSNKRRLRRKTPEDVRTNGRSRRRARIDNISQTLK